MADRSISISLEARVQGFVSGLRNAQQATNDLGNRIASFAQENEQHLDRVGKAGMVLGGGILAGIGLAVKSFAEFDKAMSEVQASTHESQANMDLLRDAAIEAGADTAFSAKEAAEGINELAKAGVTTKDILGGGLTGALSLAAAGSLGVGEAAEIAASALTQFGLAGKDIPHLADLLAAGAGKAQGSVQDMGAALNQSGLVAAATGLTIEETTGALAAFASAGMTGSDAGTSFKTMLMSLNPNSKEAAKLMEELGIKAYDSQGSFIGMSEYAGVLQGALKGMGDEQRNATLKTLFGSDAVRAANILYEQGASGIEKWEGAVNDAGYAAQTAALMQDNLAGDLEKLGGSFDSVLIKGGGGAAEALRGLVQGLEDVVDAVGSIPTPVMNATVGIAAITGGVLLLGGGLMTVLPQIIAFRAAQAALAVSAPRTAGAISFMGKAAGVAAVALIALVAANAMLGEHDTAPKLEATTQAILKLQKSATTSGEGGLDSLFKNWDSTILKGAPKDVDSLSDAVRRLANKDAWDDMNKGAGEMFSMFGGGSAIGQVTDRIKSLGDAMGQLAKNGATETAAESFQLLTKEFEANGKGAKEALESVPGYKDALQGLANQAKVTLTPQELLDFAMGKVPASMAGAAAATQTYTDAAGQSAPVTEDMAEELEKLGVNAQGAVSVLNAFVEVLQRSGLLALSERESFRSYSDALAEVGLNADGTGAAVGEMGRAFDNSTEQGKKNQAMFDAVASAGMNTTQAMADATDAFGANVYSQEQLQTNLGTTFNNLVTAAGQFGITGGEADALARKVMGIPPGVNIDTWMSDFALKLAQQTTGELDKLDGRVIDMYANLHETTLKKTIEDPGGMGSGVGGRQNGSLGGGMATGGRVYGPGTPTSDSVPTMLSKDEYVIKASAAKALGYGYLDKLNGGDTQPLKAGYQYAPASAPARQAMAMSAPTGPASGVTNNWNITEQSDPMATAYAVSHRQQALAS